MSSRRTCYSKSVLTFCSATLAWACSPGAIFLRCWHLAHLSTLKCRPGIAGDHTAPRPGRTDAARAYLLHAAGGTRVGMGAARGYLAECKCRATPAAGALRGGGHRQDMPGRSAVHRGRAAGHHHRRRTLLCRGRRTGIHAGHKLAAGRGPSSSPGGLGQYISYSMAAYLLRRSRNAAIWALCSRLCP